MKFRYYITDLYNGCVVGTDSESAAQDTAESEEFFVVDSESGEWLQPNGVRESVKEIEE